VESKFLEAIRKLVEYGNREFLRSFRLRPEIKEADNGNGNNNTNTNSNNNIITTDSASLIPPFETIGFLEAKWLEVLKGLVEYGNKNILGNFALYLVMEERRVEEEHVSDNYLLTNFYFCLIVSSNQSNIRWLDKAGAPVWQCSSAPSSSVNRIYFFGQVNASNTLFGWPGNESSFSASRTSVGHLIFCTTFFTV
jgi:hypothetical protein